MTEGSQRPDPNDPGPAGPRRSIADRIEASTHLFHKGHQIERTVFFSDAVFAIAMTLLVLDLKIPDLPADVTGAAFNEAVRDKVPAFYGFVLSFVLLSLAWITHHHRFGAIVLFDRRLQSLNLTLLFFIAFMPVPTAMLFQHSGDSPIPVVLYALTMAAIGLMPDVIWWHARRANLLSPQVSPALYRYTVVTGISGWVVFLISVPLAFWRPDVAMYSWLAMIPVARILGPIAKRRFVATESQRLAAEDAAGN